MSDLTFSAEEKRNKQERLIEENIKELYEDVKKEILESSEMSIKPITKINVAVARKLREEGFKVNQEAFSHGGAGIIGTTSKYVIYWDKEYEEDERGSDEIAWVSEEQERIEIKKPSDSLTDRIIKFFMGEEI